MPRPATPAVIERLKSVVGPSGWVQDPAQLEPYLTEWRGAYRGETPLLLRPASVEQVAAVVRVCAESETALVPQGGNTGLVGGQIPEAGLGQVLVNLGRLDRIRAVDPVENALVAEAGCTLVAVQQAAAAVDRLFPLSLAAEGSAQVGGSLSTNAGGVHVLRYGSTRRLVLGLEVVTPQGEVWNGLRTVRKDNTGYDLKQLFIGAEGTLGIITAAALELYPRPARVQTLWAALPTVPAATSLLALARKATDEQVLAFELLPRLALELVLRHVPGTCDPLPAASPWYVLCDLTTPPAAAEGLLAEGLAAGLLTDAVLAGSAAQAAALWRLRESVSEAQRSEGGSLKHDVALPLGQVARFLDEVLPELGRLVPGIRPVPFGHLGDGNLHLNLSQPVGADTAAFLARRDEVARRVHDAVTRLGGSISAEHGVGRARRDEVRRCKSPLEIELMERVKRALDPQGIMNPGRGVA